MRPLLWRELTLVTRYLYIESAPWPSAQKRNKTPISQFPQCTGQISQNAPFCNRVVYTFLLQNEVLWDIGPVHYGICATGLLLSYSGSTFQWTLMTLQGPLQLPWINFNLAWISNQSRLLFMWDVIIHPCPNFNKTAVEFKTCGPFH